MSTVDEAVMQYAAGQDDPELGKVDAEFLLGTLGWRDHAVETVALGEALTGIGFDLIAEGAQTSHVGDLDAVQALALAVAMVNAEIARPVDGETAERMRYKVTALTLDTYPNAQAAAHAAVVQLGGWRKVGIPQWMYLALGDVDHDVCEHILNEVELAARNTAPGRRWVHVHRVGTVLYRSA